MNDRMEFVQNLVRLHLATNTAFKGSYRFGYPQILFDAGDDIDALMKLCRADVTSKNYDKVSHFLKNFDLVEQKIAEVEAKDHIRNFQPPVTGDEIMKIYNIPPGRIIGEIKEQIKEAILEGEIKNDKEEAMQLLQKIAAEKGLA